MTTTSLADRLRDGVYRSGLLVLLAALIVYFAVTLPAFGTPRNAVIILQSVAITAIIAMGVTISLTVGGFDLSVGSNVSFVVMLTTAAQVYYEAPPVLAVLIGLAAGTAEGISSVLLYMVVYVAMTWGAFLCIMQMRDLDAQPVETIAGLSGLMQAAIELVPALADAALVEVRAGLRPVTRDELPVIGARAGEPGLVYAAGHYRNGALLAPITARIVADAVLDGRRHPALDALGPDRPTL